uniref:Serpin family E member 3 n=1 Tax=Accipiter nisus TaxID=211598 RepID=A0A8B9N255_9AVES
MLPIFFSAYILSACWLTKGNCISYDELKELKTEFAINLYRHVSKAENRTNLVVSPASVAVSLELLQLGAQGNTFTELQDALGYNIHDESVQDFLHTVYEGETDSSQGTVVQLACSFFVDAGVQLSPIFTARAVRWANSSLQQSNFTDPNRTAAQIQEWITGNLGGNHGPTGNPNESAGSPLSQVALVSTMYFKSTWQKKFSFMDTQMLPFTTAEGSTLKVPTMHHTAEVNYGNSCEHQIEDKVTRNTSTAPPSLLSLVTAFLQGFRLTLQIFRAKLCNKGERNFYGTCTQSADALSMGLKQYKYRSNIYLYTIQI